jgi:hypothetical protein
MIVKKLTTCWEFEKNFLKHTICWKFDYYNRGIILGQITHWSDNEYKAYGRDMAKITNIFTTLDAAMTFIDNILKETGYIEISPKLEILI